MTKDEFLEAIATRTKELSHVNKDILDETFPNGVVRAYYCVRRWNNADGGTYEFYVLTEDYFIDLTVTASGIKIRQIKLLVESIEKSYRIERLAALEVEPANIILRLKEAEPINLTKPERTELGNYHDFLKSLLDL